MVALKKEDTVQRDRDSDALDIAIDSSLRRLEVEWQLIMSSDLTNVANDDDSAAETLATRIRGIEHKVIHTPAQGLTGLAVKLRFLKRALELGPTSEDDLMCESALMDLDDLIKIHP